MNAQLRSPRAHVHHLSSLRRRLGLYLVVIGLASLGLYIIVLQLVASVTIQLVDVGATSPKTTALYERSIDTYYAARPAERFRFLLNKSALLAHVQATNPEVASIKLSGTGTFGEAQARIVTRTPIARWSIHGDSQYVDADGIVFTRNYHTAPALRIVDNSGIRASDNQTITSHRFLAFVGRVIGLSHDRGLTVSRITIPSQTTRQVDISLQGVPQRYKLSIDRSTGEQVEDMARITAYLKRKGITPTYVDVRVEGKAFYQ